MSRTTIETVTVKPLNIPLLEPFTIATGGISEAYNVLITIKLSSGIVGYGECAPFPPSTGETQETALAAANRCAELIEGRDATGWRSISKLMRSVYYSQASVCAGFEIALLDALTRSYGMPMSVFFGGAGTSVETDISIPLVEAEHAYDLAQQAVKSGIRRIKVKVGENLQSDLARVEAIREAAPGIILDLDANQGYSANEALVFLEVLDDHDIRPGLLEQPVHKSDYEGLRFVTQHTSVPIAADESVSTAAEAARLIKMGAVNVINIKLMKSGIVEALDIAAVCRATNTRLMIGAMIESRLGASASAHFAAGLGGFSYIDLDTPFLLAEDPFTGGYIQQGGIYDLSQVESGLGIERK